MATPSRSELVRLQADIERMDEMSHMELLAIVKGSGSVNITENAFGAFMDLGELDVHTYGKVRSFVDFVESVSVDIDRSTSHPPASPRKPGGPGRSLPAFPEEGVREITPQVEDQPDSSGPKRGPKSRLNPLLQGGAPKGHFLGH